MKLKVTGYKIREALRRWNLKRDVAYRSFKDCLKRFPDEVKPNPEDVMQEFKKIDHTIALLQVAQDSYNLAIKIDYCGNTVSLSLGVKLIGGAGRVDGMWREVVAPKEDKYGTRDDVRSAGDVRVVSNILREVAVKLSEASSQYAAQLRNAVAAANAKEVEIDVEGLEAEAFA